MVIQTSDFYKSTRGKRYKKKQPYVKQTKSDYYQNQRITRIERKMKKDEKAVEYKMTGTTTSHSQSVTPQFALLNGIDQGTDVTQRVGNQIVMKAIRLKASIVAADATNIFRVMLVYIKDINGVAPTSSDIVQNTTYPYISIKRWDYRKDLIILLDKTFSLDLDGGPSTGYIDYYKKVNLPVMYDQGTNAVGSIESGALYLMTTSDSAAVVDPVITYSYQVYFADS